MIVSLRRSGCKTRRSAATPSVPGRRLARALSATTLMLAVAACGGGGSPADGSAAAPNAVNPVRGVYAGSLGGSSSPAFQMVVFGNGDFWSLYGRQSGNTFLVSGFVQGNGSAANGNFTAPDTRDFGFFPAVVSSTTATYSTTARTVSGSVRSASGTVTFSGGPIPGSLYDLDASPTLATVSGAWSLTSLQGEAVSLSVTPDGGFSARTSLGCTATGSIAPRATENAFDVSLRFGPAPCALPNQPASGIALAYPLAGGGTQLLVAVVDATRTAGIGLFGTR